MILFEYIWLGGTCLVLVTSMLITLLNCVSMDKIVFKELSFTSEDSSKDLVSILIPARNEEERIGECIESVLLNADEYIEILVLNDNSDDSTAEIVRRFSLDGHNVTLIEGSKLPAGWIGKHWACHQLSQYARGDYLVFIDADTLLAPGTLQSSLQKAKRDNFDLLTLMPRREKKWVFEYLMYPFIDWAIFCWLPMSIAHRSNNSYLSATFGQFMLFKKTAYELIGGHQFIRNNRLDDFELGRNIKRNGLRWHLVDGSHMVKALPYHGNLEAMQGIARSIFPSLNYRISFLLGFSIALINLVYLPIGTLLYGTIFGEIGRNTFIVSVTSVVIMTFTWMIMSIRFGHGIRWLPIYPLSIVFIVCVAIFSFVATLLSVGQWKKRGIPGGEIRF